MSKVKNRPALFLDRDGVLLDVQRGKYVLVLDDIVWIRGSQEALKRLSVLDIDIVVVSNQQCVGLGYTTPAMLDAISSAINSDCDYAIHEFFYCTHKKSDNCHCRKPQIGLFTHALRKRGIDPSLSLMVGDMPEDMLAARLAGINPIMVLSGLGSVKNGFPEETTFDNLLEATPFIEKWFIDIFQR